MPDPIEFVIMENGTLKFGEGHYFLSSKAEYVKGAGQIQLTEEGKIWYINNNSGHYLPTVEELKSQALYFKNLGVTVEDLDVVNIK
jgi:hypothetical protein